MDFTKLIQYLNSLYDTFRKDWKFFSDSQVDAIKENTNEVPAKFSEKTDIKMSVQGDYDAGGTVCIGAVRGWIE